MKKKKSFHLEWIFEPIEDDPSFFTKRMFGGLAAYYMGQMICILAENPGDRTYRGVDYDIDLFNGIMICTFKEHHDSLIKDFTQLIPHPVLGKWLYLNNDADDFENIACELIQLIKRTDPRIGITPGEKKKKSTPKKNGIKKTLKSKVLKKKVATKKLKNNATSKKNSKSSNSKKLQPKKN